jgi:hypothetical protein
MEIIGVTRAAMKATRVLVVVCSLSALPAIASAECAWVLWEEVLHTSGREWSIVGTASSQQDCGSFGDRSVADRARRLRALGGEVSADGNQVTVKGQTFFIHFRYLCLPDNHRSARAEGEVAGTPHAGEEGEAES